MSYQKKQLIKKYEKQLATFASDANIKRCLNCGDNQIIKYSDLDEYPCFCNLLPNDFDFRVILVEQKMGIGHWVSIIRQKNNIYLFDSYGCPIDKELNFVEKAQRVLLGENGRFIERLINGCDKCSNNCNLNIYENNCKFQSLKPGVSTCGRWVCLFVEMAKMGYSLDEFSKFVYTASENENLPTDILVCNWIPLEADFK
jgi:hypothetical protein